MKKLYLLILATIFAVFIVSAVEPPPQLQPLAISSLDDLTGQACYEKYATSGGYCSMGIRQYFQCMPTMSGFQWQQRSENCLDYNGRCVERDGNAQCTLDGGVNPIVIPIILALVIGGVIVIILRVWRKI